jgi:hypothetical protein
MTFGGKLNSLQGGLGNEPGNYEFRFFHTLPLSQYPEAGLLNKSSCLAPALGVTKFIIVGDMILVTLCCATYVILRSSTNPPLRPVC